MTLVTRWFSWTERLEWFATTYKSQQATWQDMTTAMQGFCWDVLLDTDCKAARPMGPQGVRCWLSSCSCFIEGSILSSSVNWGWRREEPGVLQQQYLDSGGDFEFRSELFISFCLISFVPTRDIPKMPCETLGWEREAMTIGRFPLPWSSDDQELSHYMPLLDEAFEGGMSLVAGFPKRDAARRILQEPFGDEVPCPHWKLKWFWKSLFFAWWQVEVTGS